METHTVQQGECLATIAARYGFRWKTLWEHPDNADLRNLRKSPSILYPGDVVHIPELKPKSVSISTGKTHRFILRLPRIKLRLRLVDCEQPIANVAYTVQVDGQELTGTTDGDGKVEIVIPLTAVQARLTLEGREDEYLLQLGNLDPVTEISGQQARLRNLGFYRGDVDGHPGEAITAAIHEFQSVHDLNPTGEADARTRDKLIEVYGC